MGLLDLVLVLLASNSAVDPNDVVFFFSGNKEQ